MFSFTRNLFQGIHLCLIETTINVTVLNPRRIIMVKVFVIVTHEGEWWAAVVLHPGITGWPHPPQSQRFQMHLILIGASFAIFTLNIKIKYLKFILLSFAILQKIVEKWVFRWRFFSPALLKYQEYVLWRKSLPWNCCFKFTDVKGGESSACWLQRVASRFT